MNDMPPFFYHYEFNLDRCRRSSADEVGGEVLEMFKDFTITALEAEEALVFPMDEFVHLSYACNANGNDLDLTVFAPLGPFVKGRPQMYPRVREYLSPAFHVAISLDGNEDLFGEMYNEYCRAFPESDVSCSGIPPAPWIAETVLPGAYEIGLHGPFSGLMLDAERCFAWAWLDIIRNGGMM